MLVPAGRQVPYIISKSTGAPVNAALGSYEQRR